MRRYEEDSEEGRRGIEEKGEPGSPRSQDRRGNEEGEEGRGDL